MLFVLFWLAVADNFLKSPPIFPPTPYRPYTLDMIRFSSAYPFTTFFIFVCSSKAISSKKF